MRLVEIAGKAGVDIDGRIDVTWMGKRVFGPPFISIATSDLFTIPHCLFQHDPKAHTIQGDGRDRDIGIALVQGYIQEANMSKKGETRN
jgi:hypothetical protein